MSDVAHAFMESPNYQRGALFVIYDEWGGFFDHVRPPRVPDDRANALDLFEDWGQMGFRIPAVAISPYARKSGPERARVGHSVYGHESILKLISYRFGLGDLNLRHATTNNIGESFDWEATDFEPPDLADPNTIASIPCALGGDTASETPPELLAEHQRDIQNLQDMADRFGFKTGDGTPEEIFRQPDSIKKAAAVGDARAKHKKRKPKRKKKRPAR